MKYAKYLFIILLPMFIFAQQEEKTNTRSVVENYDWKVDNDQGCVLAIENGAVMFEEQWMHAPPSGITINDDAGTAITLSSLVAPFWAEVSYYGKDDKVYIQSIRFLKQFEYDSKGYVIGEYDEKID